MAADWCGAVDDFFPTCPSHHVAVIPLLLLYPVPAGSPMADRKDKLEALAAKKAAEAEAGDDGAADTKSRPRKVQKTLDGYSARDDDDDAVVGGGGGGGALFVREDLSLTYSANLDGRQTISDAAVKANSAKKATSKKKKSSSATKSSKKKKVPLSPLLYLEVVAGGNVCVCSNRRCLTIVSSPAWCRAELFVVFVVLLVVLLVGVVGVVVVRLRLGLVGKEEEEDQGVGQEEGSEEEGQGAFRSFCVCVCAGVMVAAGRELGDICFNPPSPSFSDPNCSPLCRSGPRATTTITRHRCRVRSTCLPSTRPTL